MFRYRTGQKEKKKKLREILSQVKYETLTEPEKGFFNEMKTLAYVQFWIPSDYQIGQAQKLVKNAK